MTIQEFKIHIEEELRDRLRNDNKPTPILDRLEKHLKDFDEYNLTDLLNPKNMKHDLYISFLFQICFPSRIKMDIDSEYEPIKKKRIAIVSCKSRKQDYVCSADEMYSVSHLYKAQREFLIKGYDDYYIMSSEYGIISPNHIIKPYDRVVGTRLHQSNPDVKNGWDPDTIYLIEEQINWMLKKGWAIDIHTSKAYYDPLSEETKKRINYVKQPHGINLIKPIYDEATDMLDTKSLDECLQFIGHKEDKSNKAPINWYHPEHGLFYGTTWALYIKYKDQKLNNGNLDLVRTGINPQARGWVVDESLLDKLYQTDSGQWRLKK